MGGIESNAAENPAGFPETRWTLILSAGSDRSCVALEELCRIYWYPLYAFARRQGMAVEDAQDATQGFFADLLRREDLRKVAREKGKFRSFMLAGLRNFMANEYRNSRRLKRGAGEVPVSIDEEHGEQRFKLEPQTSDTPEMLFERNWALTVLEISIDRLKREYTNAGRDDLYAELRAYLPSADKPPGYAELAKRLGMGTSAATMSVHRMRQRFGAILKEELRQTVSSEEELAEELHHLLAVMAR